jgi:hypothetical protein
MTFVSSVASGADRLPVASSVPSTYIRYWSSALVSETIPTWVNSPVEGVTPDDSELIDSPSQIPR